MKRREADLRKVSTKPNFVFHRAGMWNVGRNASQAIILKPACGPMKLGEKENKRNTHSCLTFPSDYLTAKGFIRTYREKLQNRRKLERFHGRCLDMASYPRSSIRSCVATHKRRSSHMLFILIACKFILFRRTRTEFQ